MQTSKINFSRTLSLLLFYLSIAVLLVTGISFSKFTVSSNVQDTARVAHLGTISIVENGDFYKPNQLIITPGNPIKKEVTLQYQDSEIASYVFLTVTTQGFLKENTHTFSYTLPQTTEKSVDWQIDDAWNYLSSSGDAHTYYLLVPAGKTIVQNVIANKGIIQVSEQFTEDNMASLSDFAIQFHAIAMQYNGKKEGQSEKEAALEAWQYIKPKM